MHVAHPHTHIDSGVSSAASFAYGRARPGLLVRGEAVTVARSRTRSGVLDLARAGVVVDLLLDRFAGDLAPADRAGGFCHASLSVPIG